MPLKQKSYNTFKLSCSRTCSICDVTFVKRDDRSVDSMMRLHFKKNHPDYMLLASIKPVITEERITLR